MYVNDSLEAYIMPSTVPVIITGIIKMYFESCFVYLKCWNILDTKMIFPSSTSLP